MLFIMSSIETSINVYAVVVYEIFMINVKLVIVFNTIKRRTDAVDIYRF